MRTYNSSMLILFILIAFVSPAYSCDYRVNKTTTFQEFQKILDNATYVDSEPGIKICLAPGIEIVNPEDQGSRALRIAKKDIAIVGDRLAPATIRNKQKRGPIWETSALIFESHDRLGMRVVNGLLEHVHIVTEGNNGVGLYIIDAHLKAVRGISIKTLGTRATPLRMDSFSRDSHGHAATIEFLEGVSLATLGPGFARGLFTVRRARIDHISDLQIDMGMRSFSGSGMTLFGTEVKTMKQFALKNVSGTAIQIFGGSNIGIIEDGVIAARGGGRAVGVSTSSIGYLGNISFSNLGRPESVWFYFSNSEIGAVSRITSITAGPIRDAFRLVTTSIGTSHCNLANGEKAPMSRARSVIRNDSSC